MKIQFTKQTIYIIIAVAVLTFMFSSRRFRNLVSRKLEQVRLNKEIKELVFENARLRKEIYMIENDDAYTEHLIRRDLGYLKPGEYEYRFKKEEGKPK